MRYPPLLITIFFVVLVRPFASHFVLSDWPVPKLGRHRAPTKGRAKDSRPTCSRPRTERLINPQTVASKQRRNGHDAMSS